MLKVNGSNDLLKLNIVILKMPKRGFRKQF